MFEATAQPAQVRGGPGFREAQGTTDAAGGGRARVPGSPFFAYFLWRSKESRSAAGRTPAQNQAPANSQATGHGDAGHNPPTPYLGRCPRSIITPTRFTPGKIPSLVTATFTHGAPNSSRTKRAIRSASASINKKCSAANKARTRSTDQEIVAGAAFQPVVTLGPEQLVVAGEAECALIDDAQFAELARIEGGTAIKSVWKSDKLPPMVVVAFPSAPAAERSAFKTSLAKVCSGEGKAACGEVGIKDLSAAGDADYAAVIKSYGK